MVDLFLLFAFSALGMLLGVMTGLIPGIHPNNVALILLSLNPFILSKMHSIGISKETSLILFAVTIVSASISHTFLGFLPAAFIGAPDADTALSLLPAHRLLLEGRAYEATVLSAIGSFGAVIFSLLSLVPFYFILSHPFYLYETIQSYMLFILIGISMLLILTESFTEVMVPYHAVILSSFVFLLSGFFGYVIIDMPVRSLFLHSSPLFPAITGLFGLSTILFSLMHTPNIPEQRIEEPFIEKREVMKSIIAGSTFGAIVSFLPAITAAHATVMAMLARRNREPEQVIVTLSSVNTSDAIFCIFTLFLILKARSGVMMVVDKILEVPQWLTITPPPLLIYLLIAVLIAGSLSYFMMISV
ncbi:MAG: tripartite tricarboxylate transporter permease, partial [Candidatus Methanospirareceae archaeon]